MQEAARVAQHAVREELAEVERRHAPQAARLEQVPPRPRQHAHLAPVLVLDVARRLLERERLGLVDGAAAALHHQVREAEVVAERPLDVVRAADRVDRAVAAGDRAERRLALAQPHLVAPVDAFAVRAVLLAGSAPGRRRRRRRGRRSCARACAARPAPRSRSRRRTRRCRSRSRARRGSARRACRRAGSGAGGRGRRRRRATISSVRSVEPSEATTISSCSAG